MELQELRIVCLEECDSAWVYYTWVETLWNIKKTPNIL